MEQSKKDGEEKKTEEMRESTLTLEEPKPSVYRGPWSRYRNFRRLSRPAGGYGETNKPT